MERVFQRREEGKVIWEGRLLWGCTAFAGKVISFRSIRKGGKVWGEDGGGPGGGGRWPKKEGEY